MLTHLFRRFILLLVRIFYPRIEADGMVPLRLDRPTIFVLNHPNGMIDPLALMIALARNVSFLAKSTLWGSFLWRFCMNAFEAIPVYRQRDEGEKGSASSDRLERNERTFAQCRALLRRGGLLALFPEGTTHSESTLLPLKSGAARIALGTEMESGWTMGLQIVPVGLWYADKVHFRSALLMVFGAPFDINGLRSEYIKNVERAVDTLTDRIDVALDGVVLQAENAEVLNGVATVARWTGAGEDGLTADEHFDQTARLLHAYQRLREHDPTRLDVLATQARRYADALRALGVRDPWRLELRAASTGRMIALIVWQIVAALPALAGAILSFPYWFAGLVAERASGPYPEVYGTAKVVAGAVLITAAWIIFAIVAGVALGAWYGVTLLLLAPALAYIAMRWGETWRELRELLRARWLRTRRPTQVAALIAERQALAAAVREAADGIRYDRNYTS